MDYRQYDSAIGRFNSMDRLSELAFDISPYRFGLNNPIAFNDPTGLFENSNQGLALCPTCPDTPAFKPLIDDPNNTYVYDPETQTATQLIELEEVVVQGKPKTENLEMPWSSLSNTLIGGGFGGYVSTLSIQAERASLNYVAKYGSQLESAVDLTLKNRLYYAKLAKGAGRLATGVSVATTLYSGYSVYHQYKTGGINNVNGLDVADTTVGVVGLAGTALVTFGLVSNPVGWGIGAAVIIYGGIRLVQDINNNE